MAAAKRGVTVNVLMDGHGSKGNDGVVALLRAGGVNVTVGKPDLVGEKVDHRKVLVVDPYQPNPYGRSHEYWIAIDRVVAAVLLGIVTHDANLLVVYPARAASDRIK